MFAHWRCCLIMLAHAPNSQRYLSGAVNPARSRQRSSNRLSPMWELPPKTHTQNWRRMPSCCDVSAPPVMILHKHSTSDSHKPPRRRDDAAAGWGICRTSAHNSSPYFQQFTPIWRTFVERVPAASSDYRAPAPCGEVASARRSGPLSAPA